MVAPNIRRVGEDGGPQVRKTRREMQVKTDSECGHYARFLILCANACLH